MWRVETGLLEMGMGARGQPRTPSKRRKSWCCAGGIWGPYKDIGEDDKLSAFLCILNHSRMISHELSFLFPS